MQVPLLDLRAQYAPLKSQFLAAIEEVCDSQALVLGPRTESFERAVADYCGAKHAIGCSSGTDAQLMLLMAMGIGPADAVITTPYTFFATASCISRLGARPVFADIDPVTYNISPESVNEVLAKTPNVKAIIPVHLYGCCADMASLQAIATRHNIPLLEDAAQALGAQHALGAAGTMGLAGWFSFYPTKNLGAFGDAGMVVTNDDALATKLRAIRNHGMEVRYYHKYVGGNFRIDAIQSAVLQVKLPHLDPWSKSRRTRAARYRTLFSAHKLERWLAAPTEPWKGTRLPNHHIYNQFIVRTPRRDDLRACLGAAGISTEIYYPLPLHLQECFSDLGYKAGDFPESERAALETIALPIFPELTDAQQDYVVERIATFFH